MRSKASRLLVLLSLAAVLVVAGVEALLENRKETVRRSIESALGRAVAFDSISLNFLGSPGSLGITVTDLRVADDPRFAATPLVQADQLTITLGWLSLLAGKPTVSHVVLHRPEIQIIRNEYGDINFLTPTQPLGTLFRSAHRTAMAVHAGGGSSTSSTVPPTSPRSSACTTWPWRSNGRGNRVSTSTYPAPWPRPESCRSR